jgi:hypothetical protein
MKSYFKRKAGTLLSEFVVDYLAKDPFSRSESLLRIDAFLDIRGNNSKMLDTMRRKINNGEGRKNHSGKEHLIRPAFALLRYNPV